MYNIMIIADKFRKLVQSKEESNTMIQRGIKYKAVENGWVPILNVPTVSLIDYCRTESSKR